MTEIIILDEKETQICAAIYNRGLNVPWNSNEKEDITILLWNKVDFKW